MQKVRKDVVFLALLVLLMPLSVSANSLQLYAAGSLKAALSEIAASYEKAYQTQVTTKFGPSGLLGKRQNIIIHIFLPKHKPSWLCLDQS